MGDNDYTRGRKIFAAVTVTYRFGREEDEIMGLNFSKEMQLCAQQIYPCESAVPNEVQDRLIKKLGANAHPFQVTIPEHAPSSVQLQTCGDSAKPLGVIYELRVYVGENSDDKPHKRNSVNLAVRKVQYCPNAGNKRQPSTLVSKGFTLSSGKLNLEVTLDKEVYYHGEQIGANINVNNNSKKTGKTKDSDVNLASSTLVASGKNANESLGIIVSYSVRVRANCGAIGGELVADLPFKLTHPAPSGCVPANKGEAGEDNIVLEDFARMRRGMSVDQP